MAIRVQRHSNVSKQATLLDGLGVSPLKWRVCGCGLNRFVCKGMNHISNVKVHLMTRIGNVNIIACTLRAQWNKCQILRRTGKQGLWRNMEHKIIPFLIFDGNK